MADAKALGLKQEYESGVHTCCQIAEWAQEQGSAWIEATLQDVQHTNELMPGHDAVAEGVLVPVRLRKPVPRFKQTDRSL